jgi:cell division inhibitor SepF
MSGVWDRTLVYLGLREEPDHAFDDLSEDEVARFDADHDPDAAHAPPRPADLRRASAAPAAPERREPDEPRRTRRAAAGASAAAARDVTAARDPEPVRGRSDAVTKDTDTSQREPRRSNVTRLPTRESDREANPTPPVRVRRVTIGRFEDAEHVGRRFRDGSPVLVDLRTADAAAGRRVVDFAAGLAFGLQGRLVKVAGRAFLLLPRGVTIGPEERRRLEDHGYTLPSGSDA